MNLKLMTVMKWNYTYSQVNKEFCGLRSVKNIRMKILFTRNDLSQVISIKK